MENNIDITALYNAAVQAKKNSYSPYSNYRVGAALISINNEIYTGCNIENASYSPTVCAERVAFFKAVSQGERKFTAILIVGGRDNGEYAYPCGVCRQVMSEFCNKDFIIIVAKSSSDYKIYTLNDLLPNSFILED